MRRKLFVPFCCDNRLSVIKLNERFCRFMRLICCGGRHMRIGIVDADLLGRKKHRFPNLACEKIAGYWKEKGAEVELLENFIQILDPIYSQVFVSKVFTDTEIPEWVQESDRVHLGGTGFFFDKAPNLPDEIEHHMPDYHLYDNWIENTVRVAREKAHKESKKFNEKSFRGQFKEYTDYSIGFITRGCFRKCPFCVNQKYDRVFLHSPIEEFYDAERKKICLLDDNFLGCPEWRQILETLQGTGKKFKFKQGMDERLLTEERCKILFKSKYDGHYTFAFDNVEDYELIHQKLQMIRRHTKATNITFYVLVGFKSTDAEDIANAFKRIELLLSYKCLPYVMRYMSKDAAPWKNSKYRAMYIAIARWCNQPNLVKKMTFREFCEANQRCKKTAGICSTLAAMNEFENENPEIAEKYFDVRYGNKYSTIK